MRWRAGVFQIEPNLFSRRQEIVVHPSGGKDYRPNLDTRKPIIVPPTAPMPMMGAYAFVMMASGMLSNNPNTRPTHHPGQGRRAAPIANPMPKRAIKAAVIAALLSGN